MNHFNICSSCMHCNSCVLTEQKEKVWSCSEFDDIATQQVYAQPEEQPKRELELV
ncbi:hypothetical protein [Psychroserpens damuponensis]|uniref:hypothetical protein n=1 Tax=Psychroserpens damuponensis TaxID=943936 RepID=UPI00137929A4|nr:hypothetical protein [Psychroserpens damuponensis]